MIVNRARIWFAVFVLVVFGAGLASGILIGQRMTPWGEPFGFSRMRGPGAVERRPGPIVRDVLLRRLTRELDLTDAQRTQIEEVLRARRGRLESFQRDVQQRFRKEEQELHDAIRAVLTPEQREQFDRLVKERPRRGRRDRRP